MKIYLAGNQGAKCEGIRYLYNKEENMKIYLAGSAPWKEQGLYDEAFIKHRPYILESFYYVNEETERLLPYMGDFLLDSGAFTLRQNTEESIDWLEFTRKYANYINRNRIEKFFELDIDNLIGYDKVVELRKELERLTNKQPIPVFHPSRGKEEFIKSCEEYPYVALGGIVGAGVGTKAYNSYHERFPWFIKTAHEHKAKIHGLGFTSLINLPRYHFDSVDSTAWVSGSRFGYVYYFDGKTMQKINVPKGKRLNSKQAALHNFVEWIKFQDWAETHL